MADHAVRRQRARGGGSCQGPVRDAGVDLEALRRRRALADRCPRHGAECCPARLHYGGRGSGQVRAQLAAAAVVAQPGFRRRQQRQHRASARRPDRRARSTERAPMRGSGHPVRVLIARLAVCRCTLVALLPVLPQSPWFHEHVQCAHEIHYLRSGVAFANPFMDNTLGAYILGFIVAIWRPGLPARSIARRRGSRSRLLGASSVESGGCYRAACRRGPGRGTCAPRARAAARLPKYCTTIAAVCERYQADMISGGHDLASRVSGLLFRHPSS